MCEETLGNIREHSLWERIPYTRWLVYQGQPDRTAIGTRAVGAAARSLFHFGEIGCLKLLIHSQIGFYSMKQKTHNKRVKFAPFGRWDRQKAAAPYPNRWMTASGRKQTVEWFDMDLVGWAGNPKRTFEMSKHRKIILFQTICPQAFDIIITVQPEHRHVILIINKNFIKNGSSAKFPATRGVLRNDVRINPPTSMLGTNFS